MTERYYSDAEPWQRSHQCLCFPSVSLRARSLSHSFSGREFGWKRREERDQERYSVWKAGAESITCSLLAALWHTRVPGFQKQMDRLHRKGDNQQVLAYKTSHWPAGKCFRGVSPRAHPVVKRLPRYTLDAAGERGNQSTFKDKTPTPHSTVTKSIQFWDVTFCTTVYSLQQTQFLSSHTSGKYTCIH